jgi:hypothetical protein
MNRREFLKTAAVAVPAAVVMPSLLTAAPEPLPKVRFGLECLEDVVSLQPGQLAIVVGGPGTGKSFLMWRSAIYNARHGMNTAYVDPHGYGYGSFFKSDDTKDFSGADLRRLIYISDVPLPEIGVKQHPWFSLDLFPPNSVVFFSDAGPPEAEKPVRGFDYYREMRAMAVERQLALVMCHSFSGKRDRDFLGSFEAMRPADLVLNVSYGGIEDDPLKYLTVATIKNRCGPGRQIFWYSLKDMKPGQLVPCHCFLDNYSSDEG